MKNKRMRYISITAAILLVFVLLMLLFSNRSGDFSAMEAQDGVLDATSADFSSAVYEIDGEWTFYPEVLGSGAELRTAQPEEHNESIPYQLKSARAANVPLGGYSFITARACWRRRCSSRRRRTIAAITHRHMLMPIYTGGEMANRVVHFILAEQRSDLSCGEHRPRAEASEHLYSWCCDSVLFV